MKMEDIHPGVLVWWDEPGGAWAFTEIGENYFKLRSLRDFEERTFNSQFASCSLLSNSDFATMRPCTLEEARNYINGVAEELKKAVEKKKAEVLEAEGKVDAYYGEAKTFLKDQEPKPAPSVP